MRVDVELGNLNFRRIQLFEIYDILELKRALAGNVLVNQIIENKGAYDENGNPNLRKLKIYYNGRLLENGVTISNVYSNVYSRDNFFLLMID